MATFQLFKVDKHGRSMYRLNGNKNTTVRLGASIFEGAPPATIEFDAEGMAKVSEPRKRLTKEERAALPKPTPAEKLAKAQEIANRAAARAAKLAAALNAKLAAALNAGG